MFEKKGVLLILDGLGDRPVAQLGGRTPLEAARTPVMDRFATAGLCGFVQPVAPGIPVSTQTGSGLLLGLPPAQIERLSRGWVQAVGAGIAVQPNDIALRCNFATLRWESDFVHIIDRRAGRISDGTEQLVESLRNQIFADGVEFLIEASTQHRVSLVLRGEELSGAVSNTDPGDGRETLGLSMCRALRADDRAAVRTAEIINSFVAASHSILKEHPLNRAREAQGLLPANGLITRGAGSVDEVGNILRRLGIRTAVVSGEGTLLGLGRLFDFDVYHRPEFTATTQTDLVGKVASVLLALENHDLVVLHVKGPDVCSHDRDPVGKKIFFEAIDAALEPLQSIDIVVGITADHSTDSNTGRHTGDPVPSLIASRHGRKDTVKTFGESGCMTGGLGCISPTSFLCIMLDQMNRMYNFYPGLVGELGL